MKINFICFICLLPLVSFSQITVQQSALPVVGQAWGSYYDSSPDSTISITPAGPGQNWNYSTGWVTGPPKIDNFISPTPLNGFPFFPYSNIAEQNFSANYVINYFFRNDPAGLYLSGSYAYDTSFNITKTIDDNLNVLHVPFTYGNNASDTSIEEIIYIDNPSLLHPAEKHISYTIINFICDAWGTMITPCYQNPVDVIRIRRQEMGSIDSTFIDSTNTGNGPWTFYSASSHLTPSFYVDWNFFQNNSPCIVLSINTDTNLTIHDAFYYCDTLLSGINSNLVSQYPKCIFPNPAAGDFVHIRIPGADVKTIVIYNLAGFVVKELDASGISTINLSTSYFPNGIYFCVYFDGEKKKVYSEKFVVNK